MTPISLLLLLLLLLTAQSFDTFALDELEFYEPSLLTQNSSYTTALASVPSLNAGLWAAANSTRAEQPFVYPPHAPALELVVNTSASPACTGTLQNLTSSGGVATLPTGAGYLGKYTGLGSGFAPCASVCCSTLGCAAFAYYETSDEGPVCQLYQQGYSTGPQPFPAGAVLFAQGAALTTPPAAEDDIANGLRSGTFLGSLGTGGYEVHADGTFHLSTIRNQGPAAEPWQGVLRDLVLAVAIGPSAYVVGLKPLFGLSPVPQLVYQAAFPVAKFELLQGLRLYAYTSLRPGDSNASNTPAVVFTLHVTHSSQSSQPALNVTFVIAAGLGLRSDWRSSSQAQPLGPAFSSPSDCAAACASTAPQPQPCLAWQYTPATGACALDRASLQMGANAAGLDSGFPGAFASGQSQAGQPWVVFQSTPPPPGTQLHNALGSQGLFTLPGAAPASGQLSYQWGVGPTMEALLAPLAQQGSSCRLGGGSGSGSGSGDLFAAASASVQGLLPGDSASLSLAHAWHYPHAFWYRDAFKGSDTGVRYAATFPDIFAVADSLNLTAQAGALLAWQRAYSGLPHPLLRDAAANMLGHLRSSQWLGSGEYRQWEALEFVDWGNPTNGDERHLPYLALAPDAMRSQLLTWVNHAQNSDGSYYCIIVSGAGDAQYGHGDPCAGPAPHPDDIAMVLIAAYEQLALRNDTALVTAIYPSLLQGFRYYAAVFNSTPWHLPYRVHETYDAVAESAGIVGEGNQGYSLFNALQYLNGLACMQGLAESMGDGATAAAAASMRALAQATIQRNLFQPATAFYAGDTLAGGTALLTEPSGQPYRSSDSLHGQALAYRLGLGEHLPRVQMQLHQGMVAQDLATPWGLRFDSYSAQNWLMGDHAASALALHWNEVGAWNHSLRQLGYFRRVRRDASRHSAVVDTDTGGYGLLNYYGYALFFYHTLHGLTGQVARLHQQALSFAPHYSAFNASTGEALLPLVLAGALGTVAITPTTAQLILLFGDGGAAAAPLFFLNITICQHMFVAAAGAPWVLGVGLPPLLFTLPAPCDTASPASASTVTTTDFCSISASVVDSSTAFSQDPLPAALPTALPQADCQAQALAHRFCGYQWQPLDPANASSLGLCTLVPGGGSCYLVPGGAPASTPVRTLALCACNFSAVYTAPQIVNTSSMQVQQGVGFGGGFEALDSAVFSFVVPLVGGWEACLRQAGEQQACGALHAPGYGGAAVGSCRAGSGCCVLNPYKGCEGGGAPTPGAWGNCSLALFGNTGVLPDSTIGSSVCLKDS